MKKLLITLALISLGLFGVSEARACEPILDILLFSDQGPGECPVPTTTPRLNLKICLGGPCRSFGGSDKGQFGQLKKDMPGDLQAAVFRVVDNVVGKTTFVVPRGVSQICDGLIPKQTLNLLCDRLFKIKGVRPVGSNLNSPLCTFDNLDDVNTMTTTNGVIITDVDGNPCESRIKPQYWLYYNVCCEPGVLFGDRGDRVDIDLNLVINDNGQCVLNPVRKDSKPEVIPISDSNTCS